MSFLTGCQNPVGTESVSNYDIDRSLSGTVSSTSGVYITEISDSSSYTSEFVEIYNSSNSDIDLSGWTLEVERGNTTSSTSSSSISLSGTLSSKNFIIITRDASQSTFENVFSCTLDSDINFIDSNNGLIINKTYQKFVLTDGSDIIDNIAGNFLANKSKVASRNDISDFSDSTFTYTANSVANATAGTLSTDQETIFGIKDSGSSNDFDDFDDFNGYYTSAENLTGNTLKTELNSIIDNHKTVSYSTVWTALKTLDEDPDNSDNVILLYTQESRSKALQESNSSNNNVSYWNREHVWVQSHGDFGTSQGPGTDLHHLRPSDKSVNGLRDDLDFDDGGSLVEDTSDCYSDSDSWEPPDEVKGDIARMVFYMVVRYEGSDSYIDLELVDYTGTSGAYLGKLSTLKEWHANDPVSNSEVIRNEKVYTDWQHNRNPFIDHPEWVEEIW